MSTDKMNLGQPLMSEREEDWQVSPRGLVQNGEEWRTPEWQEQAMREHFGSCPECGKTDGFRNIGRDHYFICHVHKTCWYVGSNLFSGWREDSEETQRENRALLESYSDVTGWPKSDADGRATGSSTEMDDVEVEHILHGNGCAIHHHTVGVFCDCGAVGWFEIMPRKVYEAMLPTGAGASVEKTLDDDLPF